MPVLAPSIHHRLADAVTHATGAAPPHDSPVWTVPLNDPAAVRNAVRGVVGPARTVVVTGTLDRRLILIDHDTPGEWTVADLSGQPHATRAWPSWTNGRIGIAEPDRWLSAARIADDGRHRLLRPRVLLVSLYHPEHFPLPRFPLAISDLARAARTTLLGQVELLDMQLGTSLEDIQARLAEDDIDILGISATFGQHDLMTRLLDHVTTGENPPLVAAGGSLTARNERVLLERYPNLIIGRGAGEPTIADVLAHWHSDLPVSEIRGAGYTGAARDTSTIAIQRRHSATVANRAQSDIWPELDLLDRTLTHHGVAQLETSRGCTNFCSFCPRSHKGQWAGAMPEALPWLLNEIGAIIDRHPGTSRTLYLVDEEFIGRGEDAVPRALNIADTLHQAGFTWETSCRIDQVVHLDRDRDWHVERGHLWRGLVERGLRRCLFGVESGVTSILHRFAKETTAEQNALAIRTLTALGVPPRFTYITFDHLMTETELRASAAFQTRTDLLLAPQPGTSVAEIVDGVRDTRWVAAHATGRPFYTAISYPLVGMECLIGAAYTRRVQAAGLAGEVDPAMGRIEAAYQDWRIGVLAGWAQRWIDHTFALDYTFKSLEKLLDGQHYHHVRDLRRTIKHAAHRLLQAMIDLLADTPITTPDHTVLLERCATLADMLLGGLRAELRPAVTALELTLPADHRALVHREYERWRDRNDWELINAADPCGS